MVKIKIGKWILYAWFLFATLVAFPCFSEDVSREIPAPPEPEKKISGGVSVDFVSKYVWRGIPLSEGPVLQSEGWLSAYGAQFTLWGNLDYSGDTSEIDLQAAYQYEWKHISVQPILIFYFFPNSTGAPPTGEAGLKVSYALGPFQFTTGQAFDIMEFGGAYFGAFSATFQKEVTSYFSLETGASLGWANAQFNQAYFGVSQAALNFFQWDLALTFSPHHPLFFSPHLKVSTLLNNALRQQVSTPTNVYGGLQVGVEF